MSVQRSQSFEQPMMKDGRKKWWKSADFYIPASLIFLSLVPTIGGAFRVSQLALGGDVTAANARFFDAPLPVAAHIIGAILYAIIGAFQFAPNFRRRHGRLHRLFGRILIPSSFVVALSGLWMNQFYTLPEIDGLALYIMRLVVGIVMLIALVMAIVAIRKRRYRQHGAWMIRTYALALGAGTQVFTGVPLVLFWPDALNETTRALTMGAGWLINAIVAEVIIRRGKIFGS